ncbi:Acetylglucosaminyltransferase EXT1/exostosin 1 [Handroanthus impetiginosus]|uniref:Acetylglucosaminyltransferase EXT1/exostosin 1 n=1 Tax=Handroanthus impetiginosus TaxID=429701 RepID=A0A2G9HGQ1_9LAMI|nr:Acetylglucosaminyltransferase EXT1/exostosin 1 [Handroanthus impetiginosus]
MFSLHKWKCSWSLAATIASILALVSVVHLFLYPMVPSLDYLSLRQAQNSCLPVNGSNEGSEKYAPSMGSNKGIEGNSKENTQPMVDLNVQYPADLHNAVTYHGAPWKAEIGQWLSGCHSNATEVEIIEKIRGKSCKNECSGQGICNRELGQCRCFHGFTGEGCSERLQLNCNYPGSEKEPYGHWVVSICPAHCDTSRAMCFCGEGTKYPNRPAAESCGFKINPPSEPGAPRLTDWTTADRDIFTINSSIPGWCNVDPMKAYASKVSVKEECDCKYDGLWGRFCEVPVQSVCINQCSGHGHCRGGFCQCQNGWYGVDCSIPSVLSSIGEWPKWLRPAHINVPDSTRLTGNLVNLNAVVQKKRPLIYVYDLPPDFNSLLLEGRHFKLECVNRIYDDRNATLWTEQLYGAQMAIYESILASPYRTLNGDEADYFFVPVLDSCIITRADDAPHLSLKDHHGLRSSLTLEYYKMAYEHIMMHYPYWNQSSGKDHIWFFSWDEGACYAPKEIWNSMMLVHWGNTNSKHNHSTTAYWADNWNTISSDRRGNHPCFDPEKDLVLPAWKRPDERPLTARFWARPREERKTLFYFNGNLGPAYENGRPEATYSMGIRQKMAEEFGSSPNKEGKLGKQHAEDVVVTPVRADDYQEELANSTFCGVMPGDGWSGRMEDSILQGCIPVVIQDGIYLPYEKVLSYESFAVRISEDEIPNLINILRSMNETEVELKLANVKKIWQRFLYRDSIMLEAERQNATIGLFENWAVKFSELDQDDAFTTLIQVLHYKLHNDPWRRQFVRPKKDFGLPGECLIRP